MGLFDFFNKKVTTNVVEAKVNYVINEKGEKFLHIKEFRNFLEISKNEFNDPKEIGVLNSIISALDDVL